MRQWNEMNRIKILLLLFSGVKPVHLIAASIMSAPAALAMAKLLYPETHNSSLNHLNKVRFHPPWVNRIIHTSPSAFSKTCFWGPRILIARNLMHQSLCIALCSYSSILCEKINKNYPVGTGLFKQHCLNILWTFPTLCKQSGILLGWVTYKVPQIQAKNNVYTM